MTGTIDPARLLLRHTVATVAYRGGKAVRGAPPGFAAFRAREGTRTPGEILAHIGDLFDWAVSLAQGAQSWRDSVPLDWEAEIARFDAALARFDAALARFDAVLADRAPLACGADRLFQGPVADALTHIGQIAMLRRMAGGPVRGENYFKAAIDVGRVGPDQAPPRREFD